jgi:hypothetical protein
MPTFQTLPDSHTDFPFSVTVESWLPILFIAVAGIGVALFVWRRRAR